jgi:hypothetical protein
MVALASSNCRITYGLCVDFSFTKNGEILDWLRPEERDLFDGMFSRSLRGPPLDDNLALGYSMSVFIAGLLNASRL